MPSLDFSLLKVGSRYDRRYLAALWGYQSFHALSRGVVTPSGADLVALFVTRGKQLTLTQYNDYISGDLLHWEGEKEHGSDARLANAANDGVAIHLFYREVHHAPFEYRGEVRLVSYDPEVSNPSRFVFRLVHDLSPADDLRVHRAEIRAASVTDRNALVKARLGQGRFRDELLRLWNQSCAITGLRVPELLRASHIKPWRLSSNAERLDANNGLLLLPQYDSLFDRGLVTFATDGSLVVSRAIAALDMERLGIVRSAILQQIIPGQAPYLEFHRKNVFVV